MSHYLPLSFSLSLFFCLSLIFFIYIYFSLRDFHPSSSFPHSRLLPSHKLPLPFLCFPCHFHHRRVVFLSSDPSRTPISANLLTAPDTFSPSKATQSPQPRPRLQLLPSPFVSQSSHSSLSMTSLPLQYPLPVCRSAGGSSLIRRRCLLVSQRVYWFHYLAQIQRTQNNQSLWRCAVRRPRAWLLPGAN